MDSAAINATIFGEPSGPVIWKNGPSLGARSFFTLGVFSFVGTSVLVVPSFVSCPIIFHSFF